MRPTLLALILFAACEPKPGAESPAGTDDSVPPVDTDETDTQEETGETDTQGETDTDPDPDTGEPIVLSGSATIAANPYNQFSALVTVTVDHDAMVRVEYGEGTIDHATPEVAVAAGVPTELVVLGLRGERTFTLGAVATAGVSARWDSEPMSFTTDPVPRNWPTCNASFRVDESEFDEDEVVCTNGSMSDYSYMYMCVDRWGEPVLSIRTPDNDSLMSMRALRDGTWASTSFTESKVALFDQKGEQVAQYTPAWFTGKTRFEHYYVDSHELYQIPSGEWEGMLAFLTTSYEYLSGGDYKLGNGLIVFDPVLEEVLYDYSFLGELDDGESYDEKMPFSRSGYGDYSQDWNHGNTVLHGVEDSGREFFLISLKSQDWILKLYPDTDELAWALGFEGDFTLVDDIDAASPTEQRAVDWAFHQHGVVFLERGGPRSRLLMFDNGYPRSDESGYRWDLAYSRLLELRYDEETLLADIQFEYGDPRGPNAFLSSTCGNTQLLPGDQAVIALDGEGKDMFEVSYPDGEKRWELSCSSVEWCEYRVSYAPSLYELTWDQR